MFAGLLSKADAHFYLLQPFCRFGIFGLFKLYLHEIHNHNFYSIFPCESKKETDVAENFSKFVWDFPIAKLFLPQCFCLCCRSPSFHCRTGNTEKRKTWQSWSKCWKEKMTILIKILRETRDNLNFDQNHWLTLALALLWSWSWGEGLPHSGGWGYSPGKKHKQNFEWKET